MFYTAVIFSNSTDPFFILRI